MPELSVGTRLALTFAMIEASASHHPTASPDHVFNGLAKLGDLTQPRAFAEFGIPPEMERPAIAEITPFITALRDSGLDPKRARRQMRALFGDGGATQEASTLSPDGEAILERAVTLARENGGENLLVRWLMIALLEHPSSHLSQLLGEMKVDANTVQQKLRGVVIGPIPAGPATPTLDALGIDLTAKAREGKLQEAIGRRDEMLRMQQVLGRKDKNAPVLIGEAGVGKTAIVEGFAYRIGQHPDKTHPEFRDKRIIQINAASLVAGTGHRGDFEKRLMQLIDEATHAPDVILFIDEIHLLTGAGAGGGSAMDAANIFKPALGSGQIRLIGATTEAEYRRYIEKDPALERRFEPIRVEEPDQDTAREILKGIAKRLTAHHKVDIEPEAIEKAITLSVRYLTNRRLPDKAKDLLDDACAAIKFSTLSYSPAVSPDPDAPLNTVTADDVAKVLAKRLGLPLGQMNDDLKKRVAAVDTFLSERVVGQPEAVQAVSAIVRRHYSELAAPNKPIGVFMFVGPTGVGKTELAKTLAAFLFHSPRHLIRLDMGEYGERHNLARLIGAPPGYVGYEEGGQLTNALRTLPYAVVLLDEVEKAAPEVMNVFLSAFDAGRLTDGQGRTIDTRNVLFIMTSNLGFGPGMGFAAQPPTRATIESAVRSHFSPEFLNRVDAIVHFNPLQEAHMAQVVKIQVKQLREQLAPRRIGIQETDAAVQWLAEHGYDAQLGARPVIRLFTQKVIDQIGGMILRDALGAGETVLIDVVDGDIRVELMPPGSTKKE